jgi:TFIIF-interacting CTD phosphatase-like protein
MTKTIPVDAEKTPPRSSLHNARSPIASIKRPRGKSPSRRQSASDTTLSPLHPPRQPIQGDKVTDELFSPVLHFDPHVDGRSNSGHSDSDDDGSDVELKDNDTEPTSPSTVKESPVSLEDSMEDVESLQGLEESDSPDDEEFNPWQFIKSLPAYSRVSHMLPPVTLPTKTMHDKITLVLDLDETLVHCTVEQVVDADFLFDVVFHGVEYSVHVKLRPYLSKFLDAICGQYEVIVFTASQKVYADQLLDRIDPGKSMEV